jgi:hypothetical protein
MSFLFGGGGLDDPDIRIQALVLAHYGFNHLYF